ncbi:MAG: Crp/Fnr family transcriptional regulator [Planctomycetes bacterium]|nr:Crp/Fnr family transcriptional regulator [Planctomycetota bacterium]
MPSPFEPGARHAAAAASLRAAMHAYAPLADETFAALLQCCRVVALAKGAFFVAPGEVPREFGFVVAGLLRGYVSDVDGNEYNKVFFDEGRFPGAMVALLTSTPSRIAVQALEPSQVLAIDFAGFRRLLQARADLMWFQIQYLERNWLLQKEPRELALVQDDADVRYARFLAESPGLARRLPLFHIASHLGITPTQLSRIRRARRDDDAEDLGD